MMNNTTFCMYREQGSTLIVALIMLLLISLIAVSSMQDTILQERMVSNTEDRALAFEAAEAALREGETVIDKGNVTARGFCDNPILENGAIDDPDCDGNVLMMTRSTLWMIGMQANPPTI